MRGVLYRLEINWMRESSYKISMFLFVYRFVPCHAEWLAECYNHMTTTAAQNVIQSGWKSAGITDVFQVVVKGLGSLDPFQDIDPLIEQEADENSAIFNATRADITVLKSKYSVDTQQD